MSAHLSVRGLCVATRTGGPVLTDLSFDVDAGRTVALVGPSGSGKSTAALALLGLLDQSLKVTAGTAMLVDRNGTTTDLLRATSTVRRRLAGREIATVFQDPLAALNPIQTIGRQVSEALAVHERLGPHAMRKRVRKALSLAHLDDPERIAGSRPDELSGGMRQRALIALALAAGPRLLIADEPTTALDVTLQAEILAVLRELRQAQGLTLILITHDMGVVAALADDVVVLDGGRSVENGPATALFETPKSAAARTLVAAIPGEPRETTPRLAPAALTVTELSVRYEERRLFGKRLLAPALQGASLSLGQGEIVGVVGGSGSGKTTLGRAVLGLVSPAAGRIELHGRAPGDRVRAVQAVFQDPAASLNPRRRVVEIIGEPLRLNEPLTRVERNARVAALMARVDLDASVESRFPHALSGGQKQRVAIARALALAPRVMVADEALSSLDTTVQARILDLLRDLADRDGLGVLLISHDLAVVGAVCDRVYVLEGGRIVEHGPPAAVLRAPQSDAARRLVAAIPRRPTAASGALSPSRSAEPMVRWAESSAARPA